MHNKQLIGQMGENLACKFLSNNEYIILKRNFKCRQGEIDIIATDTKNKELVFIEVKSRSNAKYGKPAEAVNREKRRHIYQCIEYYIYSNKIINLPIRIDVIEIFLYKGKFKVNHIKHAF